MICLTRCNILGRDPSLLSGFQNDNQRQEAFLDLPVPIQHRLNILEIEMKNAREAEMLIERVRTNLTISDLHRQTDEKQKLLEKIQEQLLERNANVKQEKRINQSLDKANHWRVGVAPCRCGARGKAYNIVHIHCDSNNPGNLYYYNNESNRMICGSCRKIISCRPEDARCLTCGRRVIVTKVF